MENEFLRKQYSRWQFQKYLRSLWARKRVRIVLGISVIALIISLARDDNYFTRRKLESERNALETKMQRNTAEINSIRDTLDALKHNDKFLTEKYARERYNMVKEGETVYKFVKKEKK